MTWGEQLGKDRLEDRLADFKTPLDAAEAVIEANRCLHCFDAPCIHACPTGIDIPTFIGRIATNHVLGAAKTILDSNVLGHSCAVSCPTEVLCEGACVYNRLNKQPIFIGKLQRYAVEDAYKRGVQFYKAGAPTGKRIALIGAGPASLACAHELRKLGHETVLYEKLNLPGGLNTHGIAPYKMKALVSLKEIEQIAAIGVQFEFEKELGRNLHIKELLESFDAVFLGLGLGPDSLLDTPGSNHPRIMGAVHFISLLKTSPATELSWLNQIQSALVVGGGNTAMDACRELKGLAIPHVIASYRRGEEQMSGYRHEFKMAREEGVEFWFNTLPAEFTSLGPTELRAKFRKTRIVQTGKSSDSQTVEFTDETMESKFNLVLVATGQSKLNRLLGEIPELSFEKGKLKADSKSGRTDHPKIYAGGDLVNGGMEVVNAVAEGKRAALAIHEGIYHG